MKSFKSHETQILREGLIACQPSVNPQLRVFQ